ncbi:MAG TPA: lamin tail domain-containing protein [Anaerolineales bacterium]|nr:lamin tail domain-containing protein [Anaerolineales bacterium]
MKIRNRPLWVFVSLILILAANAVRAVADDVIYLPLIVANATMTPTVTPSPTPTPLPHTVIDIVRVANSDTQDPLDEYVEIHNRTSNTYTLTGWFIRNESNDRYDFPVGFRLYGHRTIRVWSRSGVDTSYNLFWNSDVEIWNDFNDCAYLRDDSDGENVLIDAYCYSSPLWYFRAR